MEIVAQKWYLSIRQFCLIILFSGFASISYSQFISANGTAITNEEGDTVLLRGMGLGGWMLQEGYMLQTSAFANAQYEIRNKIEELIGPDATQVFYDNWLTNYLQEEDLDSLKAWGFNSVRLPMHYNLYTLPIEDEPVPGEHTWLDIGFEMTDSLLSWCSKREMYVILDLHAAPGGQGAESAISDYDPSKPSLWQSQANQDKTVALWQRLAERYKDEPWMGGYDLLNETNWNMDNNEPLKNLYLRLTDSIRAVDQTHIIFIEGNWFANDFTNLTPPWDDNLVYSPHKYWSFNFQEDIQWVLDIRDQHNVPLWFGESGENSNTWFRDAIKLMESYGIGWAWWPYKKVESISGPLSVRKSDGYQELLDYWEGTGPKPSTEDATEAIMQLAEDLKLVNCKYQKDVIDAMIRQVYSDQTIPYATNQIPGTIYATDFDMGSLNHAYYDADVATYHVSNGSFTAWNQGWAYRNDGVDIQPCEDDIQTNGYNVGWTNGNEWMNYTTEILEDGAYSISLRLASENGNGRFHFEVDDVTLTEQIAVSNTGGWQTWETLVIPNVILSAGTSKIKFFIDQEGVNVSSFLFEKTGESNEVQTTYLQANTKDKSTISLQLNKSMNAQLPSGDAGFRVFVNGDELTTTMVELSSTSDRVIEIRVNGEFTPQDDIKLSYTGDQVEALDGTILSGFSLVDVENTIINYLPIPGRIEAEDYHFQSGVQLETTTDEGGGQNIGFLDAGDFLEYYVDVSQTGLYKATYRTAALSETGGVRLRLIDENGNATTLSSIVFQPTGGWQDWRSTSQQVELPAGRHLIRMEITKSMFNMNWFEFSLLTSTEEITSQEDFTIFPNPSSGQVQLSLENLNDPLKSIEIYDVQGKLRIKISPGYSEIIDINLQGLENGIYILTAGLKSGKRISKRIIIAD